MIDGAKVRVGDIVLTDTGFWGFVDRIKEPGSGWRRETHHFSLNFRGETSNETKNAWWSPCELTRHVLVEVPDD